MDNPRKIEIKYTVEWEIDENDTEQGVSRISFVEDPAMRVKFYHFTEENQETIELENRVREAILKMTEFLGTEESENLSLEMQNPERENFGIWDIIKGVLGGGEEYDDNARDAMKEIMKDPKYLTQDINLDNGWTYKVRFKYVGDLIETSRDFCKTLVRRNKLYMKSEIDAMDEVVGPYIPRPKGSPVSIFEFKGGCNCRHSWVQLRFLESDEGKVRILETLTDWEGDNDENPGGSPVNDPVDPTNISRGLRDANLSKQNFSVTNEEQRIVAGPVLIPNNKIPRWDKAKNEWFDGFFSKDTIKKISEKYMKELRINQANLHHIDNAGIRVTMLESWIIEDPAKDKSSMYGFNLPVGTWFASFRVNDMETWEEIKAGRINGFSVESGVIPRQVV